MGKIQTNVGLITGIPIADTVDQLMQFSARPRDMLSNRTNALKAEQLAVTRLSALLVSVQYTATNLGKTALYQQRQATSSNPDVVSVSVSGTPPMGSYQFTPLQTVQSQQFIGTGFSSRSESLGTGTLSFRFGSNLARSTPLEIFGGGAGFVRGSITITDRSGASAEIDLSTARTVDDVLDAINDNTDVNVTATTNGDKLQLVDNTGQTVSNLKVNEVRGRTTAASLGLDGIDVAADSADGQDMIGLTEDLDVDFLNDGAGVHTDRIWSDIQYTLADGTIGEIDLSPLSGAVADVETTLGEIIEVINAAEPGKLVAEIAPDGDRLLITDSSVGGGTFELESLHESTALADLGLDRTAVGGVITGSRLLGGVNSVLLSSLNGGTGLGQLGSIDLTDRSGATDSVDLSGAETVEDVLDLIGAAAVGITAELNDAKTGLLLTDTTGATASNLIVANGDATNSADTLGIAVDEAVTTVDGGDLHLQVVAQNTRLEDLNGGAGVSLGSFTIRDTTGQEATLDLSDGDVETVRDLIAAVDRLGLDLYAEINASGDGIRLVDVGTGSVALEITDSSSGTAADLHLLGDVEVVDVDGQDRSVIDGSGTFTVTVVPPIDESTDLDELNGGSGVALDTLVIRDSNGNQAQLDLSGGGIDTLGDVIDEINNLGLDVYAEINETEDGIRLVDTGEGDETLKVYEGGSTTAADLHLLGEATADEDDSGDPIQVIDGAYGVQSLDDLVSEINNLGAGVTAMVINDGTSNPYRLSIVSDRAGTAGSLVVETSGIDFGMSEMVEAKDSLLMFGPTGQEASNLLISGTSNTFRDVFPGVTLTVKQPSDSPVTVTVGQSDSNLVGGVTALVNNYNNFRQTLLTLTEYNSETNTASVLTGDGTALRLDTDLSYLLSGSFNGAGSIGSLATLGLSFNDNGTLLFDQSKLQQKFAEDPDAVNAFFTTADLGFADKLDNTIERLAGQFGSLLTSRIDSLQDKISSNEERIEAMNERLEAERGRLEMDFYRLELAIGKMQTNLSALDSIQIIKPLSIA